MRAEFGVTKEQAWVITAFRPGDEPPREIAGALGWKIALPSSDPGFYHPAEPLEIASLPLRFARKDEIARSQ